MAKVLCRALTLLIISVLLIAGCSATESYIVGIDKDYPPFSYIDANGAIVGFDVESIQWIAEQKGFEVEIVPIAWDDIIPALLKKEIDMIYSGMSITPTRAKQITFSVPYWDLDQGVVVKKESGITMEEFGSGDLIIGVNSNTTAAEYLEADYFGTEMYKKLVQSGKIEFYSTFPESMFALEQGVVDAVMFDNTSIESYIWNKPALIMLGIIPTGEEYGVAMRNDDIELHEIMNRGLAELMFSDKWGELMNKYIIIGENV